ncbi:MAG: monovalent cation/H(+) antiporter subunit G, partial [Clostridia bacterium]
MIIEYIQFGIAASFMLCGVATIFLAVFGVYKFNFALNRMHSAALGDTLGMSFILFGLIILKGFDFISLKILLVLLCIVFFHTGVVGCKTLVIFCLAGCNLSFTGGVFF